MTVNQNQIYNAGNAAQWRRIVFGDSDETLTVPSNITFTGTISITSGVELFTGALESITPLATPSALSATQFTAFASTVNGATVMGYGSSYDAALLNRAGTAALGVTANTTNVVVVGSVTGAGVVLSGGASASGAIWKDATFGLSLQGVTGATNDLTLLNPAQAALLNNPTGTQSLVTGAAFTVTGASTFTTSHKSITALATPGALAATQFTGFASTVSGAAVMGFGTTNDVTLMNRAGTVVLGITANTTGVTMAGALAITGALSGVTTMVASSTVSFTGATFTLDVKSTTAFATPSAFGATTADYFASTVSGAAIMGFGTTNDVALLNRAGTVCLGVGPNTTVVNVPGSFLVTGVTTHNGAVTVNAATTLGTAAGTDLTTIGGTAYGAGVASIRLNGLSTAAVSNQVGTLTNAPVAGNPAFWFPLSIAGTVRYVPCW